MELTVTQKGQQAEFKIDGGIDEPGAEDLKAKFGELDLSSLETVVFDFSRVNHIGSAGIGKLLLFYKNLNASGGNLHIRNASASIQELFSLLKLNAIFNVSPPRPE